MDPQDLAGQEPSPEPQGAEDRFRALVEHSSDAIVLVGEGGRILYASPSLTRVLGCTPEELLGRSGLELVHPEDVAYAQGVFAETLASPERHVAFACRARHKDQSWRYIEGVCHNRFHDPSVGAVVVNYRDVTARREAEEERRRLQEQLLQMQKLESLGVMAGGIAHDFNNLLTAMLGFTALAREEAGPDSPALPYLAEVEKAASQAADLTRQMLAYAGKGRFVSRPCDLSHLVREMLRLLETVVPKRATLRLELDPALPLIEGDATLLSQVILNLITNASDALAEQEGTIALRTAVVAADAAFLQTVSLPSDLPAGNYVCLEVTDSGCGISAETLPGIFEPFFTTKFAGRGLGLAATAGIIRSHRGTIKVASAPGQGSTFQVLFPCAAIDRGTSEEASGPTPQLGAGTILVVDDEDTVRSLVRTILERAGFVVLEARHGQEGVDLLRQHAAQIALVLLDLTMPQLSGQETLAELRRLRPDIRVLLMSGCNREEATERLADLRLAGFIEKPFSATDLVAAVQRGLA